MNLTEAKSQMIMALKKHTVPFLRQCGFKGSIPHFRRPQSDRIDLLTFQFDRHGGGFVVEIAQCPLEGVTMYWGEKVPPNKVSAHDLNDRFRLGSSPPAEDHWFRYDTGFSSVFEELARRIASLVKTQGETWWREKAEQCKGEIVA